MFSASHTPIWNSADMISAELDTRGWTRIPAIRNRSELLQLANSIGHPVASPTGEIVKSLRPVPVEKAPTGTLSSVFGLGPFPLHTDTAFWPIPARYVVLRVQGDIRRHSRLWTFAEMVATEPKVLSLAERSVWLVRTNSGRFYCSLRFRHLGMIGWRFDQQCMHSVNKPAQELEEILRSILAANPGYCFGWSRNEALVLSNWQVLHSLGSAPEGEGERVLERIYIR
jgi:alpha-ketoglutarate-dependent taurine dioxygenase